MNKVFVASALGFLLQSCASVEVSTGASESRAAPEVVAADMAWEMANAMTSTGDDIPPQAIELAEAMARAVTDRRRKVAPEPQGEGHDGARLSIELGDRAPSEPAIDQRE